jgi:predicted nuclease of predicted toxin-antitoxin system
VAQAPKIALDEDVRPALAKLLRERGFDAAAISEAGRYELLDEEQLEWAAEEGRVFVSHNVADFPRLAGEWQHAGRAHAGIIMASQGPVGWLLREVLKLLAAHPDADDWQNSLRWTRRFRARG